MEQNRRGMIKIHIYFDAACKNKAQENCPMGLGVAIFIDDEYQEHLSRAIGVENHHQDGTSNIGEWLALCEALKVAKQLRQDFKDQQVDFKVFGDSQLVVNQFNLIWRIKDDKFLQYFRLARSLNESAKVGDIIWVRRELNKKADELSKQGLQQLKN